MKYEETARRLRKALNNKNMTAQELSNATGIGKASISQYVNGSHKMTNIRSNAIGQVLGVNPLWLMGFDAPMETDIKSQIEIATTEAYINSMYRDIYDTLENMTLANKKRVAEYAAKLYELQKIEEGE